MLIVVVEQHGLLKRSWVNLDKSASLIDGAIGHSVIEVIVEYAAMEVNGRWVRGYFSESVRLSVQQILPGVDSIITAWRSPFDIQELFGAGVVARGFVRLVGEILDVSYGCITANDVEESRIICDEVCGIQELVAE